MVAAPCFGRQTEAIYVGCTNTGNTLVIMTLSFTLETGVMCDWTLFQNHLQQKCFVVTCVDVHETKKHRHIWIEPPISFNRIALPTSTSNASWFWSFPLTVYTSASNSNQNELLYCCKSKIFLENHGVVKRGILWPHTQRAFILRWCCSLCQLCCFAFTNLESFLLRQKGVCFGI